MSPHFYYNLNLTQKIEDQSLIFMDIPPNGPPTLHPLLDRVWSTVHALRMLPSSPTLQLTT